MDKEENKKIDRLMSLDMERFCHYYTQYGESFGNGALSYSLAYDKDLLGASKGREIDEKGKEIKGSSDYERLYSSCAVGASRLLTKDKIVKRVRQRLNEILEDDVVDARLAEILLKGNYTDSLRAIQEYDKLRQRIVTKVDHTSKGEKIEGNTIVFSDFSKEKDE